MDLPTVLRLPRLDQSEPGFVLLHVSSAGRHALDLKLIGTDGESVFSVSLRQNQTPALRERQFTGNQEELDDILSSILLAGGKYEATRGIEAVARVDNEALNVLIQKQVEGITQKLAKIKLPETPDEEVELYEWCGFTVQSRQKSLSEVEELKKKLQEKEAEAQKLNAELVDLVQRKIDNENSIVEKFSLLLNEKKLKIRDQQRLLAVATVDPAKVEAVERSRDVKSRSPGPSRSRKRKGVKDESEEESDDGFEKMEVEMEQAPIDSDEDLPRIPDPESTADEDEEPPPPPPVRKTVVETKGKDTSTNSFSSASHANDNVLPPKRDLPFGKKKSIAPSKPEAAAAGSETESDDDDEL